MGPENKDRGHRYRHRRKEAPKPTLSRRTVFKAGLALAGGTVAYLAARKLFPQETKGSDYLDVLKYYKEMSDFNVRGNGTFATEVSGTRVNWYNFSEVAFDPNAANNLMSFYERVGQGNLRLIMKGDSDEFRAEIYPPPSNTETFLYIVAGNHPRPSWDLYQKRGLTHKKLDDKQTPITLVTVRTVPSDDVYLREFFPTPEDYINGVLNTELCQASLIVVPSNPDLHVFTQEAFCNVLSDAVTFRQMGKTFEEFKSMANIGSYEFPTVPGKTATFENIFSESQYYQIPNINQAISLEK